MKIVKNRIFLALICGVFAVLCVFAYTTTIKSEAKTVQVVKFTCAVSKGEKIADNMVQNVTVGAYNLSPGIITSKDDVVGKYADADFAKGDLILSNKITDSISTAPDRLSMLDGTRVAYSVTIKDFSDALSDKLRSGDIVSVIKSDKSGAAIPPELTYVEVLTVTDSKGVDRDQTDTEEEKDTLKTVTLLVTPSQAVQLTEYEDSGEIHFALVYRGDSKTAQKFLDKQSEVLNDGAADSSNR
ncbi:Flp pilus assembly protein CpaB [Thermocaproicibacter melissae]|uniref:Flp pilus assembly protein CpaB n=1 Tax=Thermocaproicibacter melissae TaxID=2966552 RepID=UPI0024B1B3D3|nr:Flp pilus assembly protein CpaB [Thermocaproicibacter melissae]WBY64711.1 Flp pilus assembly protein CpaB [Thermocaproicibacter melissae]